MDDLAWIGNLALGASLDRQYAWLPRRMKRYFQHSLPAQPVVGSHTLKPVSFALLGVRIHTESGSFRDFPI